MKREFIPSILLVQVLQRWPILIFFGLLGAVLGYVFSLRNPPLFEAAAVFSVGLNLDQDPPGSQIKIDRVTGKVAGVIYSDEVLEDVLSDRSLQTMGLGDEFTLKDLRARTRLERKDSRWELVAIHEDPERAAELANIWAETSEKAAWQAYGHALDAVSIQTQLNQINLELADLIAIADPDGETIQRIEHLEVISVELELIYKEELKLSRGVSTFMTFELSNHAMIPEEPAVRDVGNLVLSGTLLGILAGMVFTSGLNFFSRSNSS